MERSRRESFVFEIIGPKSRGSHKALSDIWNILNNSPGELTFYRQQITRTSSFVRSLARQRSSIFSPAVPSRAFCILFGKLPRVLSAASHSERRTYASIPTHTCKYTPIPADKSASTHVRTGATSTNHEKRVRERCITERAIDGCPLQLTCASVGGDGEVGGGHATRISIVGARDPMPSSSTSSSSTAREGEERYLPGDGCSIRQTLREISRPTRPRRRNAVDPTTPLATQCGSHAALACGSTSSVALHSRPGEMTRGAWLRRRSKLPPAKRGTSSA